MSNEKSYTCKVCSKSLSVTAFSKSQINKLEHNKIDAIKCISCTDDLLPDSERNARQRKEKQTQQDDKPPKIEVKPKLEVAAAAKPKAKSFDPSMQYIKDPKNAPIIKDATSFAEAHGLPYPVNLGPINGWRTVVKMAVRGVLKKNMKSGKEYIHTSIGLFKPGSHEVASCLTSTAHHPAINQALAKIDDARRKVGLNGYIEGTGHVTASDVDGSSDAAEAASVKFNCFLKYVLLVLARQTNTVQVSLVWNAEPSGDATSDRVLQAFVKELLEPSPAAAGAKDGNTNNKKHAGHRKESKRGHDLFHSIWVNYNPSSRYSNAITGRGDDSWRLLHGEQYAEEIVRTDMVAPPVLRFPPFVFRQANICAFTKIICNVRHLVKDMVNQRLATATSANGGKRQKTDASAVVQGSSAELAADIRCVELYAGVGTIGLNCLDLLADLNCSDENPHNLACFEAARAAIEPAALRERAAYRPQAAAVVAQSGGLRGYDLVLVDPPRKGLDDEVITALLEYHGDGAGKSDGAAGGKVGEKRRKDATDSASAGAVRNNERLIYVSCGFPAFKRDAARLLGQAPVTSSAERGGAKGKGNRSDKKDTVPVDIASAGANQGNVRYWKLVHLEGHVLFPGSDHIETLAVFDRV